MPEDEFKWTPGAQWMVDDPLGDYMAVRCAECMLRSINEPSKVAREGFIAAAQFFALAAVRKQ